MQLLNWISGLLCANSRATAEARTPGTYKWLPVITPDYCTGCGECVKACNHNCLELVWDFATLQRAADCGSDGNCMAACPEGLVIQMNWVLMSGDNSVGRWQTIEDCTDSIPTPDPNRSRNNEYSKLG